MLEVRSRDKGVDEMLNIDKNLVVVRGGGDIATGTIQKLYRAGFKVVILEIENPSAIRREVSFCEAVYDGEMTIEGITAKLCHSVEEIKSYWQDNKIPLIIDSKAESIKELRPFAVVDGILAKRNCGTTKDMAPITIGLGPGFTAGEDVDIVIETMRGHNLGKLIFEGKPMANTGIPGIIKGVGKERVIYSPCAGIVKNISKIGDMVEKNQVIATVDGVEVLATISGVLRGLIRDGYEVPERFKMADVDPREEEQANCFTISDKARAIGGAVLEAILYLKNKKEI